MSERFCKYYFDGHPIIEFNLFLSTHKTQYQLDYFLISYRQAVEETSNGPAKRT
jgi:hypothetical protein